jgi:hypothetical protein
MEKKMKTCGGKGVAWFQKCRISACNISDIYITSHRGKLVKMYRIVLKKVVSLETI